MNPIFKCITLKVHSSLEAVGLTAAVSNKLAERGISANVIAAYYHDHIEVSEKHFGIATQIRKNIADLYEQYGIARNGQHTVGAVRWLGCDNVVVCEMPEPERS